MTITFNSVFYKNCNLSYKPKSENWCDDFSLRKRDSDRFLRYMFETVDFCIDTASGDLFLDDTRRQIALKHVGLIFARPLLGIIKTAWHLSIVGPVAFETLICFKKQDYSLLTKHTIESCKDILRVPFYTLVMEVMHVFSLFMACINPNSLYETRRGIGLLESRMLRLEQYWMEEKKSASSNPWVISRCFRPFTNLFKELEDGQKLEEEQRLVLRLDRWLEMRYKFTDNESAKEKIRKSIENLREKYHGLKFS